MQNKQIVFFSAAILTWNRLINKWMKVMSFRASINLTSAVPVLQHVCFLNLCWCSGPQTFVQYTVTIYCLCAGGYVQSSFINSLCCQVKLESFVFILPGLSTMKTLSMFFMKWNWVCFITVHICGLEAVMATTWLKGIRPGRMEGVCGPHVPQRILRHNKHIWLV